MLLHASCAARDGLAILLTGVPGIGKSDLLLRLMDRGFALLADDQVEIGPDGWARPPERLAGLIEVRGLGLLCQTYLAQARPVLVAELAHEPPPRLPQPQRHATLGLPLIHLDPRPASAPLVAAWAFAVAAGEARLLAGALA
ncbi:HPr kinase/phosphorylase [Acidisoma sp. C75]